MGFLARLREKLARFMAGRYGPDELMKLMSRTALVLLVVEIFLSFLAVPVAPTVLSVLVWVLLVVCVWRMLSKNISARRNENAKYIILRNRVTGWFKLQKLRWRDRKTHIYRKCPGCKTVLRLPYRKGKNTVTCPKCKHRFTTHSWL